MHHGRHDFAERRRAKRTGRERGCWLYVPAEELVKTGVDPYGEVPFYRTWGSSRGRLVVQFYKTLRPPARKPAAHRGGLRGSSASP